MQWIALEFPALTVFSIYAFFKERLALWGFIIPFMLIFLVQPGNWWSRYTIFIVAPGIVAACYAAERLRWRVGREFIKGGAIILSLVSVFFATTHGVFAPAFVTKVAKIPRAQRTIGNIFYPEYRWVDFIPNGARIGTPGSTDSHFGRYPLFGSRLENIVIMIATPDKATFEQNLHANQIQYYFTSAGTPDAAWAAADPHDFTLIDTTDQVNRVYLIHW